MRDPRTLRPSFVVVMVSAAVSVASCGASVAPRVCDGGACPDPPAPSQCPPSQPGAGSSCSPVGQNCTYTVNFMDMCGPRPVQFFCSETGWRVTPNTCNPPPPDAGVAPSDAGG